MSLIIKVGFIGILITMFLVCDGICQIEGGPCDHLGDTRCDDGTICTWEYCNVEIGKCIINPAGRNPVGSFCEEDCECDSGFCNVDKCEDPCKTDSECDDGDYCTEDSCIRRSCRHDNICSDCETMTDCDDDDPCTIDVCAAGKCSRFDYITKNPGGESCDIHCECQSGLCINKECAYTCTIDSQCPPNYDVCTDMQCINGACVGMPVERQEDDRPCLADCLCISGTCEGGICLPLGCPDITKVVRLINMWQIGQADIGTVVDAINRWADPKCSGLTPEETETEKAHLMELIGPCSVETCNDNNPCTDDSCNAETGCVNTAINCNDDNACTADSCDPIAGCVNTDISCNDSSKCTVDTCDPATGCVNTDTSADCDDGNICTDDSCSPATGCVYTNNIAPCDDGNTCTENDVCADGECIGYSLSCDDGDDCTEDSCDPDIGCVFTPLNCHCPVAEDDDYAATGGKLLTVSVANGILINDNDDDGDALTAVLITRPSHGTLTLNADGSFSYEPATGFIGIDTFTYKAFDGESYSEEATVTIHVAKCPWFIKNELYTAQCGVDKVVPATAGILANDPGAIAVVNPGTIYIDPKYGSIVVEEDGSFIYHASEKITSGTYVQFKYTATNGVCEAKYQGIAKMQVAC